MSSPMTTAASAGLERDEYRTPPEIFEGLGWRFDLDVAAPTQGPWHVPADNALTREDDGLASKWHGFVWMNPPFGTRNGQVPWLKKFFEHGHGIGLVNALTSAGWFHDERGRVIPSLRVGQMLARFHRLDHPNSTIVAESASLVSFTNLSGAPAIDGGNSSGSIARAMLGATAAFGCGNSNCYWWGESFPACDAILTLAHVLQSLSRSDATFSSVIRQQS